MVSRICEHIQARYLEFPDLIAATRSQNMTALLGHIFSLVDRSAIAEQLALTAFADAAKTRSQCEHAEQRWCDALKEIDALKLQIAEGKSNA